jgi:cytochrome b involved in lipid metabolism
VYYIDTFDEFSLVYYRIVLYLVIDQVNRKAFMKNPMVNLIFKKHKNKKKLYCKNDGKYYTVDQIKPFTFDNSKSVWVFERIDSTSSREITNEIFPGYNMSCPSRSK